MMPMPLPMPLPGRVAAKAVAEAVVGGSRTILGLGCGSPPGPRRLKRTVPEAGAAGCWDWVTLARMRETPPGPLAMVTFCVACKRIKRIGLDKTIGYDLPQEYTS